MCLILFANNYHPEYKLILAANRDEFYHRKTAAASFWIEHPDVLGGKDLEAGGTWLGISKKGKLAMLTNYRDLRNLKESAPSRGKLVLDYLTNGHQPDVYLQQIKPKASHFNGFNLLVGSPDNLLYFSNYGNGIEEVPKGIIGLSNHLLDTPWPKVNRGKNKLQLLIDTKKFEVEDFFDLLKDDVKATDDQLPDTGIDLEHERALSSMFIKSSGYGSRSSTIILVNRQDEVLFAERVYDHESGESNTNIHNFSIDK